MFIWWHKREELAQEGLSTLTPIQRKIFHGFWLLLNTAMVVGLSYILIFKPMMHQLDHVHDIHIKNSANAVKNIPLDQQLPGIDLWPSK